MSLHPQSQAFIDMLVESEAPAWNELPPQEARELFSSLGDLFGEGPEMAEVADRRAAGIPVRLFRPRESTDDGLIAYFHGGGWVLGDVQTHDSTCRRLAAASGLPVVSVDYRRPPEDPFPAAAEDCRQACQAILDDPGDWGTQGNLVLAGDSAGGNLALAVALMTRDAGQQPFSGQILIYPVLDAAMDSESYRLFADGYGLTRDSMAWFWGHYVGQNFAAAELSPYAAPARAERLEGLPPTHLITAEYDVLRDEGETLARRLAQAGIPVTHRRYEGMLHGFVHFAGAFDAAAEASLEIGRRAREMVTAARD